MSALGTRKGAKSAYHRTKWAGEEAVRRSSLSWTIFRPSIIFGPGDAFVNMLADTMKMTPVMPVIGGGKNLMQPVFVNDVARAFAAALERPSSIGKLYELGGLEIITFKDILNLIAQVIGKKRYFVPVSMWMAIPPVTLLQAMKFPLPVTTDQLQMLQEDNIRKGGDDIDDLGIEWMGFEEGIRQYLVPGP
jgi:NADH dehydrogenase